MRYLALTYLLLSVHLLHATEPDRRVYELRVYNVNPGKMEATHDFVKKSGMKYLQKHHMPLLGVWNPADAGDERFFLLVVHESKETCDKNWAAFSADDGFKAEFAEASKDGRIVGNISRFFLQATDYSPIMKPASVGNRIFELRTYIASPNNLGHLNSRFRDHTLKLFEEHGMTNIGYFNFLSGEKTTCGELMLACAAKGKDKVDVKPDAAAAEVGLVYFLSHASSEAMKKSFDTFRNDPLWNTARTESEKKAGGSLTTKDGVKSLVLKATDYSPLK